MEPRNTCNQQEQRDPSEAKAYTGQVQGFSAPGALRMPSKQEQDVRENLWRKRSDLHGQLAEVERALEQLNNNEHVQAVFNILSVANS